MKNAKPIIFSTPMVQAIIEDRKTQTRRVVKPKPPYELKEHNGRWNEYSENPIADPIVNSPWGYGRISPYKVGDILWVKETYQYIEGASGAGFAYKAGGGIYNDTGEWRNCMFMPRDAARIFLEVKSVRAERVQDISEKNAKAEGVLPINPLYLKKLPMSLIEPGGIYGKGFIRDISYRAAYYELWDTLNAKRGYSWESNPWVWVIEFAKIRTAGTGISVVRGENEKNIS